LVKGPQ